MIAFPAGVKVWIAGGVTDMRCGMNSLALKVQEGLGRDPHGGEIFCFRGRKGDLIKVLWHVALPEAPGGRKVHLADQSERLSRIGILGSAWLSSGRNRLAQSALDTAAFKGWLTLYISLFSLGILQAAC